MDSIVEKAKAIQKTSKAMTISEDVTTLALACMRGEITSWQAMKALGGKNQYDMEAKFFRALKVLVEKGKLIIDTEN